MDIAIVLKEEDYMYSGSVVNNKKAEYQNILWLDARPKPTWEEMNDKWDIISIKIKKDVLKTIRDEILLDNMWIMNRIIKDQIKIKLGIITEGQKKWNDIEQNNYVDWYDSMIDLPKKINYSLWELKQIKKNNTEIFTPCPIEKSNDK